MRCTPEGQKILYMGPRLAVSILTATRELEQIVASQMDVDSDIVMVDDTLHMWVIVQNDCWEIVDAVCIKQGHEYGLCRHLTQDPVFSVEVYDQRFLGFSAPLTAREYART